ncbi:hypothetical protein AYI68_g1109 [Smittium mucronatum]|uniref:Telomerase activating protein Est1-like N-terminal domain-containing protein n=1 Tax=Smittium mucronatum TaxID=133383 RepID=A0A1R0H6F1_9FUNG|nr:hypothetical protein AYI68_g1109 [Smittium mucronatum]
MDKNEDLNIQVLVDLSAKLQSLLAQISSTDDLQADHVWDSLFFVRFKLQNAANRFFLQEPILSISRDLPDSYWKSSSHSIIQLCRGRIFTIKNKIVKANSMKVQNNINPSDFNNIISGLNSCLSFWLEKLEKILNLSSFFYNTLISQLNSKLANFNFSSLNLPSNPSISASSNPTLNSILLLVQASYLYLGDINRYSSLVLPQSVSLVASYGKFTSSEQLYLSSILSFPQNGGGGHGQLAILSHSSSDIPSSFFWYSQSFFFNHVPINSSKNLSSLSNQFLDSLKISSPLSNSSFNRISDILEFISFVHCYLESNSNFSFSDLKTSLSDYIDSLIFDLSQYDSERLFKSSVLLVLTIQKHFSKTLSKSVSPPIDKSTFNIISFLLDSSYLICKKILSFIILSLGSNNPYTSESNPKLNLFIFSAIVYIDYLRNFISNSAPIKTSVQGDLKTSNSETNFQSLFTNTNKNLLSLVELFSASLNSVISSNKVDKFFGSKCRTINVCVDSNISPDLNNVLTSAAKTPISYTDYYHLLYNTAFSKTQNLLDYSQISHRKSSINLNNVFFDPLSSDPCLIYGFFLSRFYSFLIEMKNLPSFIEIDINCHDPSSDFIAINSRLKKQQENMKVMAESRLKVQVQQIKDQLKAKDSISSGTSFSKNDDFSSKTYSSPIPSFSPNTHRHRRPRRKNISFKSLLLIPDLSVWVNHLDKIIDWYHSNRVCILLSLDVVSQLDILKKSPDPVSSKSSRIALHTIMDMLTNRPTKKGLQKHSRNFNSSSNTNSLLLGKYKVQIAEYTDYSSQIYNFGIKIFDVPSAVALSNGFGLVTQTFNNTLGDWKKYPLFFSSLIKSPISEHSSSINPFLEVNPDYRSFLSTCIYYTHYIFQHDFSLNPSPSADFQPTDLSINDNMFQTLVLTENNEVVSLLEQFNIPCLKLPDL